MHTDSKTKNSKNSMWVGLPNSEGATAGLLCILCKYGICVESERARFSFRHKQLYNQLESFTFYLDDVMSLAQFSGMAKRSRPNLNSSAVKP